MRPNAVERSYYRLTVVRGGIAAWVTNATLSGEAHWLWANIQELTGDVVTPLSPDPSDVDHLIGDVGYFDDTSPESITFDLVALGNAARMTCREFCSIISDKTKLTVVQLARVSEADITGAGRDDRNAGANSDATTSKSARDAQSTADTKRWITIGALALLGVAVAYTVRTFKR